MLAATVEAQERQRPKIGLVFEGGAALGLAHVGVLEYLEEQRIPVDYIGGTSMGGLVAGMYAMGKSPGEIRTLLREIDWDEALRGEVAYRDLIFRRKEDRRQFPTTIEFGLRDGFSLPSGLNAGQQIGFILDRAALPYSRLKSFDELPVPFRCVATELTQGRAEVFKDGPLHLALRSTMSLPAVFTPVKIGGKVYADGGLLNNLPVDVVKDMGADITIAVHLQTAGYAPADLNSPFGTLGRSISVVIAVNELRGREKADILIVVPVERYSGTDYKKGDQIADDGKKAAAEKAKILSTLSIPAPEFQRHQARIASRVVREVPVPEFVAASGTTPELNRRIENDLRGNLNRPVDPSRIERDIAQITGIGRFGRLDYTIGRRDGKTGLFVRAEEKQYSPPLLIPGVSIDGSDPEQIQLGIGMRILNLDFGGYRRELRTDVLVGSTYAVQSEYFRPFTGTSKWFIAPRGFAGDSPIDFYQRGERLAQYRIRSVGGGADLGYSLNRFVELRAGYSVARLRLARQIGDPLLVSLSGTNSITSFRVVMDKLDSPQIPRHGQFLSSRFEIWNKGVASTGVFPAAETIYTVVRRINSPGSVFFNAQGGTVFGSGNVGLPPFALGGVNRLSAYGENEFLANQYFLGRLGYLHKVYDLPPFIGRGVYGIAQYELGKAYGRQTSRLPNNAAAGVAMETLIGPIVIGGAVGDSGHAKWFFQVGRIF
jgi:NTE family protein